jgi:hypothetical protein
MVSTECLTWSVHTSHVITSTCRQDVYWPYTHLFMRRTNKCVGAETAHDKHHRLVGPLPTDSVGIATLHLQQHLLTQTPVCSFLVHTQRNGFDLSTG